MSVTWSVFEAMKEVHVKHFLFQSTLIMLLLLLVVAIPSAQAQKETTLYDFCSQTNCTDGSIPRGGLVADEDGDLYGTTAGGGAYNYGAVFELTPSGNSWTETVLYSFCSESQCADGSTPYAGLIVDAKGNFYGTTQQGGAHGSGTVFELTHSGTAWSETVLYSFCSVFGCADGGNPVASLVFDTKGNLYGTAQQGGNDENGVVFELVNSGSGWNETVLYSFCAASGCADGSWPEAGLIFDKTGNLYSTAWQGGNHACQDPSFDGCGLVFELSPPRNGTGPWTEKVLHIFCSAVNCTDGHNPEAGLIFDSQGNLYGATFSGGNTSSECGGNRYGCGLVFELIPVTGGPGPWAETVLHTFTVGDGYWPASRVAFDRTGNLYGATSSTVFQLTPTLGSWNETVLWNINETVYIPGWLLLEKNTLYGVTTEGGSNVYCSFGCGTVFEVSP
jgi:uncharacterized repeat protein (TIGR03803 family)